MGRGDVVDEEKEGFIRALVEFEDGLTELEHHNGRGFYEYQAYFLAAAGINEFKTCSLATEIVRKVVKWGFGYFNQDLHKISNYPLSVGAIRESPLLDMVVMRKSCIYYITGFYMTPRAIR